MKIILLSGGSGKRLWPLSNDSRSKQFLKVLRGKDGSNQSMIQRVWNQLGAIGFDKSAVIATSRSQVDMIRNQLNKQVPIVVEPERRDTFPAILLAAVYLYSEQRMSVNETISVLPVDPFVEDHFFQTVLHLDKIIQQSEADIALIGVKPTYPSAKYGYIIPKSFDEEKNYAKVISFKEKPTESEAEKLIEANALWNCGVFAFRLKYLLDLITAKGLPLSYNELVNQYEQLPNRSFDYEVVEKCGNLVVTSYDGNWKDLGTWNTLTEEMDTNQIGKSYLSDDSHNTHVINELDIPLAVIGIADAVIAASPDGILVSDKKASPRIKEVMNFDQRPMYEERMWGWYRVLDIANYRDGVEVLTRKVCLKEGHSISYQYHLLRSETWTVIRGRGAYVLNGIQHDLNEGDTIHIPMGDRHAIRAHTDLEFIEVQRGCEITEQDIVRLDPDWRWEQL